MALNLRQSLKLTQQLLMTPQLQQAIKLLQLSRMELEQFVATQIAENPILEESYSDVVEDSQVADSEAERSSEDVLAERMGEASSILDSASGADKTDFDWEQYSRVRESSQQVKASSVSRAGDDDLPNYENIVTKAKTLAEFLMAQIGELDFSEEERQIATLIIGNIDERGYLVSSIFEIAEQEKIEFEKLDDILDTIQHLDPPGVGASDLKDCLLIQLRQNHLRNGVVEKIISDHLHNLENRNYEAIAKALKIPLEVVIENVAIVAELEPIPGRQFGGDQAQIVIPDVYVFKMGNDWVVTLNDEGLPQLKISEYYKDMLEQGNSSESSSENKVYLQDKMKSAMWLIKSIQQRQRTIYKVAESIVKRQAGFFDKGIEHLKPMILKDIAEDIEMHESTISRVTNNKFMHTPQGIFELKYFFNSAVSRADGQDIASESVKKMISEIVKAEDVRHPISDQGIVEILDKRGIQLARRTVAKYREQFGILPSSKRRKFF